MLPKSVLPGVSPGTLGTAGALPGDTIRSFTVGPRRTGEGRNCVGNTLCGSHQEGGDKVLQTAWQLTPIQTVSVAATQLCSGTTVDKI